MTTAGLALAGGFILLYLGGEALVAGAVRLALKAGISSLAVGLTVVAMGTSSPELMVSLDAATRNANGIVLGSVVGSNLCNLLLVLGLSAMVRPMGVRRSLLRLDLPALTAMSGGLLLALSDGTLAPWEGGVFVAVLVGFTAFRLRRARADEPAASDAEAEQAPVPVLKYLPAPLLVAGGLGLLGLGAHAFVAGAVTVAELLGVPEAVIGLTVVALGTSLPEISAAVLAAWRGQGDLAIGNAVGSSMFNILGILGLSSFLHPIPLGDVLWSDLWLVLLTPLLLLPFAWSGLRLNRWEGALLLCGYASYVGWRMVG